MALIDGSRIYIELILQNSAANGSVKYNECTEIP